MAAKKYDVSISFHTVMRILEVMVSCGLARQVAEEKRINEPLKFLPLEAACPHTQVVCRECGAVIERGPQAEAGAANQLGRPGGR